ncbi:hypothetical protein Zm00014a_039049 [Zea mays]|uniref:Uncharacterized protein n=1 Tax=Zea mays TaxID=4577 RepID=A0A3L6FHH7_MAIZE|nr:hypothetical protein Zm00014a_039049 [Zea mays]
MQSSALYTVVYTWHFSTYYLALTILNSTLQNTIYSVKQYFIQPFTQSV